MYTSAPVGRVDQPEFINGVVHLQTALAPRDLKKQLLEIEAALGRVRDPNDKCGPRTIDLDIVLFGQLIDVDLQIPDPNMSVRWFVAIPAAELIPNWKHPESGELLSQIAAEMEDSIDGAPIDLQGISQ